MIKLEIMNKDGNIKLEKGSVPASMTGGQMAFVAAQDLRYEPGDYIRVTTNKPGGYIIAKLDETLNETLIYLKNNVWEYVIPLAENLRSSIPSAAFAGGVHYLYVRYAKDYETKQYRNLALNTHDQKDDTGAYPHASANVETRNESTFFAKNAIDGICASNDHGSYPYQSWGINRDPNAKLTIDFGRKVTIDAVGFVLRADFPHDSYWRQVSLRFDDGSSRTFDTQKTGDVQTFNFPPITTEYVVFENLIKADDESPFPALTQIELFGTNATGNHA